ncbi:MAG: bacillithiol biosynthesis deacetylase BshB1 [candidate division Zixibacteria bacterium]|nr:bacillithiol biosynthesis deacetylase BshB1 [candidate division Zixibacteria bacterium]
MSETKYDILAIGAHPDDVEVGAGGTLIKLVAQGHSAALAILTKGEMGTGGSVEIREEETLKAAELMGVEVAGSFDWGDTSLEDTYEHRVELAGLIRKIKPKIILCPYPIPSHGRRQSHPDHVATGLIAINAANLSALKKFDNGEPHQVERIYNYFLPPGVYPSFIVDISDYFDQWISALGAHKSQFLNPEKTKDYLGSLKSMARSFGIQGRCEYGQGFYSGEPLVIDDLMSLVSAEVTGSAFV